MVPQSALCKVADAGFEKSKFQSDTARIPTCKVRK